MQEKESKVKELIDSMPKEQRGMLALMLAVDTLSEKYRMSQRARSGDKTWYHLTSDDIVSRRSFSLEVFLEDNEVRVKAVCYPLKISMAKLELGDFSYPNPNFNRQLTKFRDMLEALRDELGE